MGIKETYSKLDGSDQISNGKLGTDMNYSHKYDWQNILIVTAIQASWLIGIYTLIFHAKLATCIWAFVVGLCAGQGVALGAHRGFTHNSFKMTTFLKITFIFLQTMSGMFSMFNWIKYHKLHHKYCNTDADPPNSSRGFFFSHIGWLLVKKHPLLIEKEKQIDMSEIKAEKMIMFQRKYFFQLYFIIGVLFPVSVPMYFWNETLWSSFFVAYCLQYGTNLHVIWSANSFAHLGSNKPYDKQSSASESLIVSLMSFGEGTHNFHHAFPWDSRTTDGVRNLATIWLNLLVYLGLAYDVKTASPSVISAHMKKYGNGAGEKIFGEEQRMKAANNTIEM